MGGLGRELVGIELIGGGILSGATDRGGKCRLQDDLSEVEDISV